jgi:hypothetical protein
MWPFLRPHRCDHRSTPATASQPASISPSLHAPRETAATCFHPRHQDGEAVKANSRGSWRSHTHGEEPPAPRPRSGRGKPPPLRGATTALPLFRGCRFAATHGYSRPRRRRGWKRRAIDVGAPTATSMRSQIDRRNRQPAPQQSPRLMARRNWRQQLAQRTVQERSPPCTEVIWQRARSSVL